jgi:maltose O-acetyltransferase
VLRLLAAVFYYAIAYHLPDSNVPGGRIFSAIRVFLLRRFVKKCGQRVVVESHVMVGNGRDIEIGDDVQINERTRLRNARIGNCVMIAPEVMILNYGHLTERTDVPMIYQGVRTYPQTIIADDVWVGARAILMPGIHLERGSIVAAGSLVTKNVAPYSVVGGNPAKQIKVRK